MRHVTYFGEDQERELTFITNAKDISSLNVTLLYKNRWFVNG
jgi:hypothetical protein